MSLGATLRKRWKLAAAMLLATALMGALYGVLARPVFYSRGSVRMDSAAAGEKGARLRAVMRDLGQPALCERTIERLGVPAATAGAGRQPLPRMAMRLLPDQTLEIEAWPATHELAERWGAALVAEYTAARLAQRQKEQEDGLKSLRKEIAQVTGKREEALAQRYDFGAKHGIEEIVRDLKKWRRLPSELRRLDQQIDEADRVRAALPNPKLSTLEKLALLESLTQLAEPANGVSDEPRPEESFRAPFTALVSGDWHELENVQRALRAQLAEITKAEVVDAVKAEELTEALQETDAALDGTLGEASQKLEGVREELRRRKATGDDTLAADRDPTRAGPTGSAAAWDSVSRKLALVLARFDSGEDRGAFTLTYEQREVSASPVSPDYVQLAALVLVVGGLLACVVPLTVERVAEAKSSPQQLAGRVRLRSLGTVPEIAERDQTASKLSHLPEALAHLHAALPAPATAQVILVTSALPREGKTLLAALLARACAEAGERTLLVDADLRRGRVHRFFGYRSWPGLNEALREESPLDMVRSTVVENLSVLAAGRGFAPLAAPSELEKLARLLGSARASFTRIIIDTPPVLGLVETPVLAAQADAALLVVRAGLAPLHGLETTVATLKSAGVKVCGLVLNRLAGKAQDRGPGRRRRFCSSRNGLRLSAPKTIPTDP